MRLERGRGKGPGQGGSCLLWEVLGSSNNSSHVGAGGAGQQQLRSSLSLKLQQA